MDRLHGTRPYLLTIDSVSSIGSQEGPNGFVDFDVDSDEDVLMWSVEGVEFGHDSGNVFSRVLKFSCLNILYCF